ncbi:hypothetical protein PIB30_084656 [Stylosanthes scabra]|uniref:Uncharacterized protein n=1 Tax=Stylosanthes scabra TaxID=79078 RepID=A0ABU6URE8_9FABA|nr:hypothetical protein [Stylosanthes scabra]
MYEVRDGDKREAASSTAAASSILQSVHRRAFADQTEAASITAPCCHTTNRSTSSSPFAGPLLLQRLRFRPCLWIPNAESSLPSLVQRRCRSTTTVWSLPSLLQRRHHVTVTILVPWATCFLDNNTLCINQMWISTSLVDFSRWILRSRRLILIRPDQRALDTAGFGRAMCLLPFDHDWALASALLEQ